MAINIFQGGKSSNRNVNSAANSSRAQAAKAALATPAEVSTSGNTAVASKGTLGKVGNTIGKIAGVASKFLPGLGGTIAGGLANILNDPEWWQSVPGEGLTLNVPLRPVSDNETINLRPAIAELISYTGTIENLDETVIRPTEMMITQYLMPQIRKVVNAIPLQAADAYVDVLRVNATLYALWRQLKKEQYMMSHGQTYLANMNDSAFPYFQTENSARLSSAINRLEEYLRANVRLPHTLCEYLAWRYGRVYKSSNSAKASLQVYGVLPLTASVETVEASISYLMSHISSAAPLQQANTDLFNAYFNHDLMVEIRDDTQFTYDPKEFALRTNCDLGKEMHHADETLNPVFLDSALDNPTAFMASTVSTIGAEIGGELEVLMPVRHLNFYMPVGNLFPGIEASGRVKGIQVGGAVETPTPNFYSWTRIYDDSDWFKLTTGINSEGYELNITDGNTQVALEIMAVAAACKACEIYNKDLRVYFAAITPEGTSGASSYLDFTTPAYDMALVPDTVIGQEHVYAFANLVDITRTHSMSYKQAEKLVTKEAANLVDTLDVAAVASPSVTPK